MPNKIKVYPHDALTNKASSVGHNINLHNSHIILDRMRECLNGYDGAVGIAAPQLGYDERLIIIKTDTLDIAMIDPEIIEHSPETFASREGCLSLPTIHGKVQRYWRITVKYRGLLGDLVVREFEGFDSAVIQHEIDHLNGILFVDRLTGGSKRKADLKLNKLRKKA